MTSKSSLSKVLTFRVKQLNECHQKFQASLNAYVGQIAGCAQTWIDQCEDCDQDKFVDITVQLDEAMMMLVDMTSNMDSHGNLTCLPLGSAPAGMAVKSAADSPAPARTAVKSAEDSLAPAGMAVKSAADSPAPARTAVKSAADSPAPAGTAVKSAADSPAPAGMAVKLAADSPAQTNAESQGLDASISSLLERLDALQNVTDMVQELRTDLDACKMQDSVEGMRDSLRNITSHCEMLISAQVKERFEQFHTSQLFLKVLYLSKAQASLSKSEMKDVANCFNIFRDQFAELGAQMDNVEPTVSSQPPAVIVTEPPVTRWTGFCVQCMDDIKILSWSTPIPWKVLSRGTSCGFDVKNSVFTAPVSGLYLVLFVHYQTGAKPTTIRVVLSDKGRVQGRAMITTDTTNRNDYVVGQSYIGMNAGDRFYLSLPPTRCRFQIPFFSCVLVS